ncbi:uncharacterized protein I206_102799 [Kwoniella pini CBS 10737]|uniref:Uncharacterized protein n=1 Tax=Kwoniella pini CBS 10737 TaxID=1296096 RepID=A0A1B9I6E3_9TREE|nr:uncharacterized protein I206_03153 [Kwoniella pini CBS 10737]OCF51087.1 hypothetical protein I206_03153 [Kwoniella pini CBS 10737]
MQQSSQLRSIAVFGRTCKAYYEIIHPYLYKRMEISHINLIKLLLQIPKNVSTPIMGYHRVLEHLQITQVILLKETEDGVDELTYHRVARELMREVGPTLQRDFSFDENRKLGIIINKWPDEFLTWFLKWFINIYKPSNICIRLLDKKSNSYVKEWNHNSYMPFFCGKPIKIVICHNVSNSFKFQYNFRRMKTKIEYNNDNEILEKDGTINKKIKEEIKLSCIKYAEIKGKLLKLKLNDFLKWKKSQIIIPLRIIISGIKIENPIKFQEDIERFISNCQNRTLNKAVARNMFIQYDVKFAREWLGQIQWVHGEELEKEPPCEICGSGF